MKGYRFTACIVVAVAAAMRYPKAFLKWGDLDLRNPWLLLLVVQLVMFGMGSQMRLRDFAGVLRNPRGVLVGIVCHFSVMPLVGWLLTRLFHFPPEIAAGIILIGSCSSGLASNVMSYLAGANLALSVTVTALTTMLAPVMTPCLMKLLAGTLVEVSFLKMVLEITKIVLLPIGAALLADYLRNTTMKRQRQVLAAAAVGAVWLVALTSGGWARLRASLSPPVLTGIGLAGWLMASLLAGVIYHRLTRHWRGIERWLPVASMAGIVYFTVATTAAGRDNLLQVGPLLFLAAALHNAAGYAFGYGLSRACGLDIPSARSVSFEVGLQNGGMASGIAGAMGKLATVGLAAAIFSPWMNISGSVLANYWRKRPGKAESKQAEPTKGAPVTAAVRKDTNDSFE